MCRRRVSPFESYVDYRDRLPQHLHVEPRLEKIAKHWKLQYSEMMHFYKMFQKLDMDSSGTIDPLEFFIYLNEPRTRLLNYVLPIIVHHSDKYESLNFSDWMTAIFGFCFMTDQELMQHVFQRYDSTGSGRILQNDLYKFMKQMHADNPLFPKDIVVAMSEKLDLTGYFDFETFRAQCLKYPMFIYPVYRIKDSLITSIFTKKLFDRLDERTKDIYYSTSTGDRAKKYFWSKKKHWFLFYFFLIFWCCRPNDRKIGSQQYRREALKREKKIVQRRRTGGVNGELFEDVRGELEYERKNLDELPEAVRRKYFGANDESSSEAKMAKIIATLQSSIEAKVLDEYDSDNDSYEDEFEDRQEDEYASD